MSKRLNKNIFKKVRDANKTYRLITGGDTVAAGISGGKDSLVMLYFLTLLKKYTPLRFDVIPIYLDLGWGADFSQISEYCRSLELELIVEHTGIGPVVFEQRQEKNPCALCALLRRGALHRVACSHGCNKVALGHHLDDVVNTMFLSMLFEGRFNVFKPLTYLDRMDITLIRPMIYVEEKQITRLAESLSLPLLENPCPADGNTMRDEMHQLVEDIEARFPGARRKILSTIENAGPDTFWK